MQLPPCNSKQHLFHWAQSEAQANSQTAAASLPSRFLVLALVGESKKSGIFSR